MVWIRFLHHADQVMETQFSLCLSRIPLKQSLEVDGLRGKQNLFVVVGDLWF